MAKKSKAAPPGKAQTTAGTLALHRLDMQIQGMSLRKLAYVELPVTSRPEPIPPGSKLDANVSMEVTVTLYVEGVEVIMDITVRPDPKYMPTEIQAVMSMRFGRPDGVPDEQILEFAKSAGVRMLYPYAREIVSSTASRGLFGPLWLEPAVFGIEPHSNSK